MRTFVIILLSVISFFAHLILSPLLAIFGAKIDFIMLNLVGLAFFTKKWYPPVLAGLYSGLLVDITTQAGTYINTGIYFVLAGLAVIAIKIIKQNHYVLYIFSVFIAVCVKHFLLIFVLYIMRLSESASIMTFVHGLPSALYTAIISAGNYFILTKIFSLNFMQENPTERNKYVF